MSFTIPGLTLPLQNPLMDPAQYNRAAWDRQVDKQNRWTVPFSSEVIENARRGEWELVLTPEKSVPRAWYPPLTNADVLALACGGGQQTPVLAAAGARVTVLDNSPKQLQQDQKVADRDDLEIKTVLGDMRDLSVFDDASFDLVFNPCSVTFIPNLQPVFDEAARVLRPGGVLMCGFVNPVRFLFDEDDFEAGKLTIRHRLPYSDETHLTGEELERFRADGWPLAYSHSLEQMIAGQLKAGLVLTDFYDDKWDDDPIAKFMPVYFATRVEKH